MALFISRACLVLACMTLPFTGAERPSKKPTKSHEHHQALEIRDTSHSVLKMGYSYSTNDTMAEWSGCNPNQNCFVWRRMMPDGQNLHWTRFTIGTGANNEPLWSKEYPNQGLCPTVLVKNVKVNNGAFGVADRCCCVRHRSGDFADGSVYHRQTGDGQPTVDMVLHESSYKNSNSFTIQERDLCVTVDGQQYQDAWQNSIIC
mmetsp:Transcript_2003/g.3801  ORF Transcript_2003/g.3801 Transcript_2003/m.3801 type:complete len:203 (+) Transcript_2003:89-697(+)